MISKINNAEGEETLNYLMLANIDNESCKIIFMTTS